LTNRSLCVSVALGDQAMKNSLDARQPKGLFLLFFTEMWERFGFYTLQTIVVLYMSQALLYSDEKTYLLYGAFGSLIYFTPVVGGYLADRFIGFQRSILIGGVLYIVGYILAALPYEKALFFGLSTVILANGFFKPNVSSLLGELYQREDPRRDSGFTIFYMEINIGSLMPPLITGFLVSRYGWHWGFLLASLGMGLGMIIFLMGKTRLGTKGDVPATSPIHKSPSAKRYLYLWLTGGILLSVFLLHYVFYFPKEADFIMIAASILIVLHVMRVMLRENPESRRNMLACLILMLISVIFWAFYSQMYTSLMLFASRNMDKQMLGLPIDAEFTQFFNPFFIIALSPVLSMFWIWLDRRRANPTTPMKFSIGVLSMAFAFLFLSGAIALFSKAGVLSPWWLVGNYFFFTIGELLLSPIGLAMVTKLAPPNFVGMMMGIWFLMTSVGYLLGSMLATLADVPKEAAANVSIVIYSHAFTLFGSLAMAVALVCFLLVPYLKKLILIKR
jgi:proton-dependent oligopeptide transporter, POT family